jgi:O-antigen/teichoic acid export membrane protein
MTLRRQAFSGVRWTTASSLGKATLQFSQVIILTRLLAPGDFGLIALVISIMVFLQVFADAGISNAIIHHQNISQEQLSSLYWLNVSVSTTLALFLCLSSYWVASFYDQPVLQYLLMLAAVTLVVNSLGQQLRVRAQKDFRFAAIAKLELISALLGFITTASLAWYGIGVYAITIGSLITAIVGCLLAWAKLSNGWKPQLRLRLGEISQFLKFGSFMIGNNLVDAANSQVDILLGGKLLGTQALGYYSVPKELNLRIIGLTNPIATQVGLPIMAKAQDDKALLKRVYLQTMRMTASVNFPIYISMIFFAPEIVQLLLGPKWQETVYLLQIFSVWALVRSTGNPVGSLLLALGRADLSFKWNIAMFCVLPLAIWWSSQYGVTGMATAMMMLMMVMYWPNWYFLVRPLCGAKFGEYSVQMAVPLVLSLLAVFIGHTCVLIFPENLTHLTLGVLLAGTTYLGLSWRFNHKWFEAIFEIINGFKPASKVV